MPRRGRLLGDQVYPHKSDHLCDDANRFPVAGRPTPALRVALPCVLIDRVAGGEHGAILPAMTLRRGNVADAAVAVPVIVPLHAPHRGCPLTNSGRFLPWCAD